MSKTIVFNTEARNSIKSGANQLAEAVKVTLGPRGRNVIIEGLYGTNTITKDGVTVAKAIDLEDPIENIGAQMIKEVASKTVDLAGDGTTTATIIAQSILNQGFKMIEAGSNPVDIKRGIDKAVVKIVESLKQQSQIVGNDPEKIKQVATVSSNSDFEIGKLISEGFSKVGSDGVITAQESKSMNTYIDVIEGMQFDRGYISPYFVTDSEKMKAELVNPYILIYDKKISVMKDILPLLEKIAVGNHSLLVICEDLDGEALQSLVMNKINGKLKIAVIKAPGFGDNRKEVLQDIAVLTGGTYITQDQGLTLDHTTIMDLGKANTVIITKDSTTIIGGNGDEKDISLRINQIKAQIVSSKIPTELSLLTERLHKLSGGVAVLYVGAPSELEMKEKKDRVDDALHATKAAVAEGIIAGGGVGFIRALDSLTDIKCENSDEKIGVEIVSNAIQSPLRTIIENSGKDSGFIIGKIKEGSNDYGYNARTEVFENLIETGIIDPTKVSRVSLENAASVAGTLLTTECVISNKKQNK